MMMKNYNVSVDVNHNPNWSYIPDHHYSISIIGCSGSGKTNALLNVQSYCVTKRNKRSTTRFIRLSHLYQECHIHCVVVTNDRGMG